MTNVEYQTKMLIKEIKKSNEYNQFQRLRRKLGKEPELKKRVDLYREQRFALQNNQDEDGTALEKLEKESEDLLSKSAVREFLISEQKLCYMMQDTLLSIAEAVNLDLEL